MKKKLLLLVSLFNFAFSSGTCDIYVKSSSCSGIYKLSSSSVANPSSTFIAYDNTLNVLSLSYCGASSGSMLKTISEPISTENALYGVRSTYSVGSVLGCNYTISNDCASPKIVENGQCVSKCGANQWELDGQCLPVCPSGQTNSEIDGQCVGTCSTGSHWDNNISVPACVGDIKYGEKIVMDSGAYYVSFYDGALMYCRTDGKCTTMDQNGNVIDNRWYEGSIPSAPNVYTDLFNDALTLTGNLVGKTLQFAGYTLGLSSSGGGLLMSDNPASGALNPGVVAGAGLVTLGNLLVSDSEKILMTPKDNSPMSVNIVTNSSTSSDSFESVSSKTSSDGSASFSPNGLYTYKQITDANLKTVWDTAGGVGTLPPNSLVRGSDIIYPSNNPNTAIINSPTQVEIIKTNPDNTAQSVVVNKSDLENTAKNGTDLPYVAKDYAAPQINNNGTVTQATTSTPSSTSPKTNNNTSTNPTTGQTTTANAANASGVATTSDGKSIDLSGIKGSIDQLGNQLNKLNASSETGNGILNGIKGDTSSMKGSLNGIENTLNIFKNANGFSAETVSHNIPDTPSFVDSWETTYNNLKSDFDNVLSTADELKSLVNGSPLSLNFSRGVVVSCPTTSYVDMTDGKQVPIESDWCKTFSPLYSAGYLVSYIGMMFGILFLAFKVLLLIGV